MNAPTAGTCEWCGGWTDHLVHETCDECAKKVITIGADNEAEGDLALGVESLTSIALDGTIDSTRRATPCKSSR